MSDGVAITITIDDKAFRAALTALQAFPEQLSPALNAIGAAMEAKSRLRFRSQTDPEGAQWLPSERVVRHGGQTLTKSGRLRDSLTYNLLPGNAGVEWGTNVLYAAIHQFGGTIQREAGTQKTYRKVSKAGELSQHFVKARIANFISEHAHGAYAIHMPRRAYLGVDGEDENEIAGILAKYLKAAIDAGTGAKDAAA